jgi:O-antigen ligase
MTALALPYPVMRARCERLADGFAMGAAAALPWSTSITSILIGLWLISLLPTIDLASLKKTIRLPVAALPLALLALAILGVLWADVPMRERLAGLSPYIKLAVIPLLMWQFSRRDNGKVALWAFLVSSCVLLAASWLTFFVPSLSPPGKAAGIPVRDYIIQSGVFTLCVFALLQRAVTIWSLDKKLAVAFTLLACVFFANIVFVALARTSLIVIAVLFVLLGLLYLSRRGIIILIALAIALASLSWATSSYLRWRVSTVFLELTDPPTTQESSSGARMSFWMNSLEIVRAAPIFGHGTGSVPEMFARQTGIPKGTPGAVSNPHNQIFAVAIPLGFVGVFLLALMWITHVRLFVARDFASWIGLMVVVQNIVSSVFNSHLLDFSQGWLYVLGVGIAGGAVLRGRSAPPASSTLS